MLFRSELERLTDNLGARGIRQPFQFLEMLIDVHRVVRALAGRADQKGPLDRRLYVNQLSD